MEKSIDTKIIHTPFEKKDAYGALNMPVYRSAAYEFENAQSMEDAFCGRTSDHLYSRISNPTVKYFEDKIQTITGATHVCALSSGMAAISNIFMTMAYAGSNIVTSKHLFGNTFSFFKSTLADFGVEIRFCDLTNAQEVATHLDENTCAVFIEIVTNPQLEVADLKALSAVCRKANVPLVADTTIIPFTAFKAGEFGIDIEIVSSTKYISAGATSIGGLILDYASFDWSNNKKLSTLALTHGKNAFDFKLRKEIMRNFGAYMSPDAAYLQSLGLDTLELRFEKVAGNALNLAKALQDVEGIVSVNYPGLPDNPYHAISTQQFGKYPGAMITFDLESKEACYRMLDNLKLIRRATNLFDNKSLALQVANTIYGTFTEEMRQQMNISQQTIRMSVGLENWEDLLQDIIQALK